MISSRNISRRCRSTFAFVACLVTAQVLAITPVSGQCGANSPAFPVPQTCRPGDTCTGDLWPAGFSPALPGQQLPSSRDSTDYITQSFPTRHWGHELFRAVDIVDNFLFVLYTNGLQAWTLNNPTQPAQLASADGYGTTGSNGDFLIYGNFGENDSFMEDLDVINPSVGSGHLIAAVGDHPVGVTLWHYPGSTQFDQLYQDPDLDVEQVRVVEINGRVYAFAATPNNGVGVYDVTAAKDLPSPCINNNLCPQVYKGLVGGTGAIPSPRYIDLIVRGGDVYIAVSDASTSGSLQLEIWRIQDPSQPASGTLTTRVFQGGDDNTHGLAFFLYGGQYYLGATRTTVLATGTGQLEVFNATNCLDSNGCSTLPLSSYGTYNFPGLPSHSPTSRHFLTYSVSNGDPFLYHGAKAGIPFGASIEHLLDLSEVGTMSNVTDGGGTYTESCNNRSGIDYWGDYYPLNDHGRNNVRGVIGKFKGANFYRAANGILDIHVRTDSTPTPIMTAAVTSAAPHWFDVPIGFSATAQNCSGAENWTWSASNPNGTGLGLGGATTSVTWPLCPGSQCATEVITVEAVKDICAGQSPIVNGAVVSLSDPRPEVQEINVDPPGGGSLQYPLCTELTFTADVNGRPPITLNWEIRDQQDDLVLATTGNSLVWDTQTVITPNIFADGFESGDTSLWGAPPLPLLYDVSVVATNAHDLVGDFNEVQVTLTTASAAFDDPALDTIDLGAGEFQVIANATNATEYRFEFEDPENGTTIGCQHYANCFLVDWSSNSAATHHWMPPNVPGSYGVTVEIRGCNTITPPLAATSLSVVPDDPSPPEVTDFRVDETQLPAGCSCALGFCDCPTGSTLIFSVTATENPDSYRFTWDDGGSPQVISAGQPFTHTFTTTGNKQCSVVAIKGTQESGSEDLAQDLLITP